MSVVIKSIRKSILCSAAVLAFAIYCAVLTGSPVYAQDAVSSTDIPVISSDSSENTVSSSDNAAVRSRQGIEASVSENDLICDNGTISADVALGSAYTSEPSSETALQSGADNSVSFPTVADDTPVNGWVNENDGLKYYVNGESQSGAIAVNGLVYYVPNGTFEATDGWKTIDGNTYYFVSGIAQTGLNSIDGKLYYFGENGMLKKASGWQSMTDERTNQTEKYYLVDNALSTGFTKIDSIIYYFDSCGSLTRYEGWKTLRAADASSDRRYYFVDGHVCTGVKSIEGELYYFESDGALREKDGWFQPVNVKYYIADSIVQTGITEIDGKLYFFEDNGALYTTDGWIEVAGSKYLVKGGAIVTGLTDYNGKKYYLNPDNNGILATGLISVSGAKYCAGSDGALLTGLKTIDGRVYYFGADYKAIKGWKTIDGSKYYFGDNYYALIGWFKVDGYYYYGSSSGAIKTSCTVDGYTIDANGRRVVSELEAYLEKVVESCTTSSMTKSEKLKACYKWIIDNCSYKRDYTDPTTLGSSWMKSYALDMLKNHQGNCYRYASAFAYLAEYLGYDASVVTGKITAIRGGLTAHGWVQIVINGTTYLFDANMDDSKNTGFYCYMKTAKAFPYYIVKQKVYSVSI